MIDSFPIDLWVVILDYNEGKVIRTANADVKQVGPFLSDINTLSARWQPMFSLSTIWAASPARLLYFQTKL